MLFIEATHHVICQTDLPIMADKIRNEEMMHRLKKSHMPDGIGTGTAKVEIHSLKQYVRDCTYEIHCIE